MAFFVRFFFFSCVLCVLELNVVGKERETTLVVCLFLVVVMMDYSVIYFVDVTSYVDRDYACSAAPRTPGTPCRRLIDIYLIQDSGGRMGNSINIIFYSRHESHSICMCLLVL